MRRMITAAGFVLPVTTALLGALGAPVALMAPLGLAIPALLSTRFLDISGRSAGRGGDWRFDPSHAGLQRQEGECCFASTFTTFKMGLLEITRVL